MKLIVRNVGSNYLAKVVKLPKPVKHPNADKLQLVTVDFNTVIVGPDAKEGDICVYFPLESQLNAELLSATDNFSDPEKNYNKQAKGFFNDKCRVRAVKLRGTPSEGYLMTFASFAQWWGANPSDGESFVGTEFDSVVQEGAEILVCQKYIPATQKAKGPSNQKKKDKTVRHNRIVDGQFRFHVSTPQLRKNLHEIGGNERITVTYKLHGTSLVAGNLLVNRKLKWYENLLKKLGVQIKEQEYGLVYSSRSVLKNQYEYPKEHNHFYKEDIWGVAAKELEAHLEPGITIYAEIVGFTPNGMAIQKGYDYGCKQGEHAVYVYRITQTSQAGIVYEFNWDQMEGYCAKHGLRTVPLWDYDDLSVLIEEEAWASSSDETADQLFLKYLSHYLEKDCEMCVNKVPAEGVVVRIDSRPDLHVYKLKSFRFLSETETKNNDEGYIDMETNEELLKGEKS